MVCFERFLICQMEDRSANGQFTHDTHEKCWFNSANSNFSKGF